MTEASLGDLMRPPPLTADQQRAVAALQQRQLEIQAAEFAQMRKFAAVLCDCRLPHQKDDGWPQQGCIIHGMARLDPRTGEIW